MGNSDEMKWDDLSEDERKFLQAWHSATPEQRADALAVMVNNQRRHHDDDGGRVIQFPSTPRGKDE